MHAQTNLQYNISGGYLHVTSPGSWTQTQGKNILGQAVQRKLFFRKKTACIWNFTCIKL